MGDIRQEEIRALRDMKDSAFNLSHRIASTEAALLRRFRAGEKLEMDGPFRLEERDGRIVIVTNSCSCR